MQTVAVFVALFALASAANVQYAVQHPAASVVTSQRLGGNFAYSVNQGGYPYTGHYTAGSPVVYTAGTVPAVQTVGTQYTYAAPGQYAYARPQVGTYGSYGAVPVTYGNTVPVTYAGYGTPASTYNTAGLVGGYGAYTGAYPQVVY